MLNLSWIILFVSGLFFAVCNCRTEEVTTVLLESAPDAIMFSLEIAGAVALWCGMMNILKRAGAIEALAKFLSPIIVKFFPEAGYDSTVRDNLVSNIAADFLGLGNAATPYGIKTVSRLQRYATDKYTASKSVRLFLVANSSAIQLLPTTVIAIRTAAGSSSPAAVVLPVWVISVFVFIITVLLFYLVESLFGLIGGIKQ